MAELYTVAGTPLELVGGGTLEYSEDPNKSGSVSASATSTVTVFTRTPTSPTGYAYGSTAITPTAGAQYDPGEPRTVQATEAIATITPSVTAVAEVSAPTVAESSPQGRRGRATPLLQKPTANSNGGTGNRQYPFISNRMATELGGLPLERALIHARAEATQTATPENATFYGSITATATAATTVAPFESGSTTTEAESTASVAGYSFIPRTRATAQAAASGPSGGLTPYPSLFDIAARELGVLPIEVNRVRAQGAPTATVTASASTQAHVAATIEATVTPRAIEWASVAAAASVHVRTAPSAWGSTSQSAETAATTHGARVLLGEVTASLQSEVSIDSFLRQTFTVITAASVTQTCRGFGRMTSTTSSAGTSGTVVAGLRLNPGDGMRVPEKTRIILYESDPTPDVYIPGPEIEPVPIEADPHYDPDDLRVAVLVSGSP